MSLGVKRIVTEPDFESASAHQRRVDEIQAAIRAEPRRPLFRPPPPPPEPLRPSSDPLDHHLAEEIEYLRRRLDQIGETLVGEPILLNRHAATLQSIDLINQTLGHMARVIEAEDKDAAVARVTLRELRGRLTRRTLG